MRWILILWISSIVAFSVISLFFLGFPRGIWIGLATVVLPSVIEILISWVYTGYLHKDIQLIDVRQLEGKKKNLWHLRFFFMNTLGKLIIRLFYGASSIIGFSIFLGRAFQDGILVDEVSKLYLLYAMFIFVFSVAVYLLSFFLRVAVKSIYIEEIKDYSIKFVPADFSNQHDIQNIKYLFVAYIYCLMLKIDEYYSDYKSEIHVIESKAADEELSGDESDIKKNRSVNHDGIVYE